MHVVEVGVGALCYLGGHHVAGNCLRRSAVTTATDSGRVTMPVLVEAM